jgi:hypothetical protein
VPITAREKVQTRAVASAVVSALRDGESWRLCALLSERSIRALGSRHACEAQARRQPARRCHGCRYRLSRIVGVYPTAADRRLGRKTVVWAYGVRGDPRFRGESSLELRFGRERGRWLLTDLAEDGIAR